MEIIEPHILPWKFEEVLSSLMEKAKIRRDSDESKSCIYRLYDDVMQKCTRVSGVTSFFGIMGILGEIDLKLSGTDLQVYTDMLRYCIRTYLSDKFISLMEPGDPPRIMPFDKQVMWQFSQLFQASETDEMSQKELFEMFKKFTGYPDLSQQKFVSIYQPHNYWTKFVKRVREGNGQRTEQVVYKMRRRFMTYVYPNSDYFFGMTSPVCLPPL